MLETEIHPFSVAMRRACDEARLWVGATAPNPAVGAAALDVKGEILAVAAHKKAGTDHAEAALLKLCASQNMMSRLHTVCVTLEPCNHQGKTPPCTEALIKAGVKRVIVGLKDPNPLVKGGGSERLREARIEVIEGVEEEMCRRLIHPFAFYANTGVPFITIKRAFDAQGSMIPPAGQKTFTSRESLILAHGLRKKADAIITGSGTVLSDNPLFTVRFVADHKEKRRILAILDRRGRTSKDYIKQATQNGFDVRLYQDIDSCLSDLTKDNVRDILVESGPILSRFLVDSPHWAMRVDIHSGWSDKVDVSFNEKVKIPFETKKLEVNSLLPLE